MTRKPYLVIYGPVQTVSGYGKRSYDLAKTIIDSDKYEVGIISCRWGNTSMNALNPDNPEHKKVLDRIIPGGQLTRKPDCWIMVTIPSEMQKVGDFSVLVTAGIETDICSPQWIDGCNRADLILVSSQHAKTVFENTKFEKRDTNTNQVIEVVQLKTPVDILFEGVDNSIFKKLDSTPKTPLTDKLSEIKEDFCFLFTGMWIGNTELTQDRKNVGGLIKTFLETFKNKTKKPTLILKTSGSTPSITDREEMLDRINMISRMVGGNLPNIYLLHGEFTDEEMNQLYNHNKVKAWVSFTRGEGFNRTPLEFSVTGKPVITTNWSGHLDFLKPEFTTLLPGKLEQIHPTAVVADMLIEGSKWFTVDYKAASKAMEEVFKNYKNLLEPAKRQSYLSKTNFSLDKMSEKLINVLDANIPKQNEIIIPTLKKIALPSIARK